MNKRQMGAYGEEMGNALAKPVKQGIFNRNQIKYIVIIAMVTDHITGFFYSVSPFLCACMHLIGRLTGPTMAYFVGEGYSYTKDVGNYQKRLALFALISWPAFVYFEFGSLLLHFENGLVLLNPYQSVIFTLFLGLSAIRIWENPRLKKAVKIIYIVLLCLLSCIGDWAFMDVLGSLFVHIYRNRPKAKWTAFTLTFLIPNVLLILYTGFHSSWFQLGVLLVPLMLIFLYNGQRGSKARIHKWFFYLFYPAHLAVLGFLKWVILW